MHNFCIFNNFDKSRLIHYALKLTFFSPPQVSFYSIEFLSCENNLFFQVLILDSTIKPFTIWISVKLGMFTESSVWATVIQIFYFSLLSNLGQCVFLASCFCWPPQCSIDALAFSSEVFLLLSKVTMLNTLDIWVLMKRQPLSVRGSRVLLQGDRQMKGPGTTELFCRLEQCVWRCKSDLSFCSFNQILKSCFKHLEML